MTGSPDTAADDGEPATDDASLDRLRRFGGGKLLAEMITLFLAAVPERLDAARNGLASGDVAAIEMALHSLKSSSAQLGAMRMQRLSERGEKQARAGSLDGIAPIIQDLETEFPRVRQWLERARTVEAP